MLEDRYHRGNYQEVTDRADAPLEDAVALMVRERLTGEAPPASSRKIVELWRDWIEERAGERSRAPRRDGRRPGPLRRRRPRPPRLARHGRRARQRGRRGGGRGRRGRRRGRGRGRRPTRARAPTPPAPRTSKPRPRRARPAKANRRDADAEEIDRRRRHVRSARHRRGAPQPTRPSPTCRR